VVTVAAFAVLLWRVPATGLWSALTEIMRIWLLPATVAVVAMLAVRWIRWHTLLRAGGVSSSAIASARSLLGGFALGVIMPGRLGELGRFLFVPGSDRARVILLNIIDRALDMGALGTFMVASLFLLVPHPPALLAVGVWLSVLPFMIGLPRIVARLGGLPWWNEGLRTQLRVSGETLPKLRVSKYAVLAILSTGLDLVAFYSLLRAFQVMEFNVALATFPWIVVAGGLPVSLGGLGTREGVAALLLARFAVTPAVALDVALLLFAFTGLLPALIGGVWLLVSQAAGAAPRSRNLPAAESKSAWRIDLQRALEGESRPNA
jgi:uncharacterized membrane protein YbhN (UPF0104 family)